MSKKRSGRIDATYIGTMQKCYAARGETFTAGLPRDPAGGESTNRAARRKIKALERSKK